MRYGRQRTVRVRTSEDRRGQGGGGMFGGGGGGGFSIPIGGRGGFSFTTMLIIGALMLLFGLNPLDLLDRGRLGRHGPGAADAAQWTRGRRPGRGRSPAEIPGLPGSKGASTQGGQDELGRFTRRVLADTEDVWRSVFQASGQRYKEPTLVMFHGLHAYSLRPRSRSDGAVLLPRSIRRSTSI